MGDGDACPRRAGWPGGDRADDGRDRRRPRGRSHGHASTGRDYGERGGASRGTTGPPKSGIPGSLARRAHRVRRCLWGDLFGHPPGAAAFGSSRGASFRWGGLGRELRQPHALPEPLSLRTRRLESAAIRHDRGACGIRDSTGDYRASTLHRDVTRGEMRTELRTEKLTISVVAAMMDGEPLLRMLS